MSSDVYLISSDFYLKAPMSVSNVSRCSSNVIKSWNVEDIYQMLLDDFERHLMYVKCHQMFIKY